MPRALTKDLPEPPEETVTAPAAPATDLPVGDHHRRDITGLRAIAVIALVFCHFGVPGFGGGFIGLDMFFVISGFLIGGSLWREVSETGQLAIGAFFMRRLRHVLPAYIAMAFAVLAIGSYLLLPLDFRATAAGVMAATLFLSNLLFYGSVDPFAAAADNAVMLHTWSLSLAVQVFVVLPLVFLIFARNALALWITLGACFGVSLLGMLVMTPFNQMAALYWMPFRAWEFLAGVGLAIVCVERPEWLRPHQAMSWLGLSLLCVAIGFAQGSAGYPGWQVLVPVIGTLLLLANGAQANWVSYVLSMRVPVLIGMMSYALFLWHWPVYTLTTYLQGSYAGPAETALWIAISCVLAALSWRLVEQPLRRASHLAHWSLLSAAVAVVALAVSFSWMIYRTDGLPQRFDAQTRLHIAAAQDNPQPRARCHRAEGGLFDGLQVCPIGPDSHEHTLLIWGDSHATAYLAGLDAAAHEAGRSGLVIWQPQCAPAFDLASVARTPQQATAETDCREAKRQIRSALHAMPGLRDVLLIGRWSFYASGVGSGRDKRAAIHLRSTRFGPMTQERLLATALSATVSEIARLDRDVYVLRQPPEIPHYDAAIVARALAHGRLPSQLARRLGQISVTDANQRAAGANEALQRSGAQIIDTWEWFCGPFLCDAVQDGAGQFSDHHHVTDAGAHRMRAVFYPIMTRHSG
jgi:peptidoglycan/LPS O-acetylase OafA/YrhL